MINLNESTGPGWDSISRPLDSDSHLLPDTLPTAQTVRLNPTEFVWWLTCTSGWAGALLFLYPATKVWRGIMLYPSVYVRPSVCAHHFRSITWVFIHGIFSNFAYILLSAMSGMGLLMGKIRPFLTELLPFFILEKWFLACYSFTIHDIWMKLHRYVAHQRLHIVTKDRHSDLSSLWVIRPW